MLSCEVAGIELSALKAGSLYCLYLSRCAEPQPPSRLGLEAIPMDVLLALDPVVGSFGVKVCLEVLCSERNGQNPCSTRFSLEEVVILL